MVPAGGGTPRLVERGAANPQYGSDNDRLFMTAQEDDKLQLVSTDRSGEARRVHATGDMTSQFQVSPDGRSVAFRPPELRSLPDAADARRPECRGGDRERGVADNPAKRGRR
jgi:hypothetical protein